MPNRIVREGILTSDRVDRIADDPATEVFYRRLHSVADDYGRYSAHPSLLRAALYPLRLEKVSEIDVSRHLAACAAADLIRVYRVSDKPYLELFDFRQKTRAKSSKYPSPVQQTLDICGADAVRMPSTCGTDAVRLRTETETRADGAMPLDEFFEERYARHPKKRDRIIAQQYLVEIPGIESYEVQERFRSGHEAWVQTDDYQWKGGAKCPTFAVFITDSTWKYPPSQPAGKGAAGVSHGAPKGRLYVAPKLEDGDANEDADDWVKRKASEVTPEEPGTAA